MREVAVNNNFTSQNPTTQVFGLGGAASADTVEIEWPDGSIDSYTGVDAGTAVFHQ
jgi:enediyne biosynthesis protein E4